MNRREALKSFFATAAACRFGSLCAWPQNPSAGKPKANGHSAFPVHYFCGTSYYPEQWPDAQVREDFKKMRQIGCNLVRMGEFAWSTMQPRPDRFEFEWLDRAIELAAENSIAVVLGTPTASVPPWLYRLHPDVLSGNEKGPYTYGGRKGFCLESPAMRAASEQIITKLANRYGNNPAVVGWQLSNEPGHPAVNYDPNSLVAFRAWLKNRYKTLENLNAAWSGPFWSNQYDDWDEIVFPLNSAEGGWHPGVRLDYRRFFSDSFLEWLRFENRLVRARAHNQFVYTNWPEAAWSVDIFESAAFLDATAWDNYGPMPGAGDVHAVVQNLFNHDLCRAARGDQRFFLSEQATQPPADGDVRSTRLATWIDVAYGSCGSMFFEFRPPLEGSELGTPSMLEPDGSLGVGTPTLRKTFVEIARIYPTIANAKTRADLALIYSYDNSWDQGFRIREGKNVGLGYDNFADRFYGGLKSLKRNVDVIPAKSELDQYKLITAPGLRIVSDEQAGYLDRWVRAGGVLVLDRKAGTLSPDSRLRPLVEPGVFADLAGVRIPLTEPEHGSGHSVVFENGAGPFPVTEEEFLQIEQGECLARFRGGLRAGQPAISLHAAGRGYVIFIAFRCTQNGFYDALFSLLARRFSIAPLLPVPPAVDVVSRSVDKEEFLFLLNYAAEPAQIEVPAGCHELLSGASPEGHYTLPALEIAILQRRTS